MTAHVTDRIIAAINEKDIPGILAVCEEADRALTGKCRFAEGEYWRQFVEFDFQQFFKYLEAGGSPITTVKLSDEQSKLYIESEEGGYLVYIWAPETVADAYEKIWNRMK